MPLGGPILETEQELARWFSREKLNWWRRGWKVDARGAYGGGKAYRLKRAVIQVMEEANRPMRIDEISEAVGKTPSYISRILKELGSKKLVSGAHNGDKKIKFFSIRRVTS